MSATAIPKLSLRANGMNDAPARSEAEVRRARAATMRAEAELFYDVIPDHVLAGIREVEADTVRPATPQAELLRLEIERIEAILAHERALFADDNRTRKIMARQGNTDGAVRRQRCCLSRWASYREFRTKLAQAKAQRWEKRVASFRAAAE